MHNKNSTENVILLSISFVRNIRYLLLSDVFKKLKENYTVVIISPFSDAPAFVSEFQDKNVEFLTIDNNAINDKNFFIRKCYALSEYLRLCSFTFRYRKHGLSYYWKMYSKLGIEEDGKFKKYSWIKRISYWCLGWVGYFPWVWRTIDKIGGKYFYPVDTIHQISKKYKKCILLESANFGYQARYLGFCAKLFNIKTIMLPYSTDQILIFGFLINKYDLFFPQGMAEFDALKNRHNETDRKIVPLGNLWLYNLKKMQPKINKNDDVKYILYAGNLNFPRISEFEAIEVILNAIKEKKLPFCHIIYRPIVRTDTEKKIISARFQDEILVSLQFPSAASSGMVDYNQTTLIQKEIENYCDDLSKINVFIMSISTSMFFDALSYDIPVISNHMDPTGYLQKSGHSQYVKDDVGFEVACGIPIVYKAENMITEIAKIFSHQYDIQSVKKKCFHYWHYENDNYLNIFMEKIENL